MILVNGRELLVRAVFTRSERLKDAVDFAYREKYNTPGALHYVKGFKNKKRRDTTPEISSALETIRRLRRLHR